MRRPITIQAPTKKEKFTLRFMIVVGCLSLIYFMFIFFSIDKIGNKFLYLLLCITLGYSLIRILYEWYHYWDISVPKNQPIARDFTVDILTTYFPGEPYEMVENTLLAIKNITYPHTTILCDEANDPHLITFCLKHGIRHISRSDRADAKAGNINNALRKVSQGEICVILDPDHVPAPDFLDHVLPYFADDKIGFVQIVQAYKNLHESYVAKGAAQQTFQFYGPIMMCMNSYGTVNAIGANCTFRRAALDSINGHAPGLAEDMHTAMQLHAKGWKSVYVPKILARGLVPSSLTAYYKQQLKWARGTTDLLAHVYPKLFKQFNWRQRIHYGLIPLHYIIGFFYMINFLIPIISLSLSITPWKGNILQFGLSLFPLIATVIIIRNYVQRWVMEETERGFHAVGGLLQISTWWIFCLGCIYTLFSKKIPYLPTPKTGEDKTSWKLLAPNILVGVISLAAIVYGLQKNLTPFSLFMAGFALLNAFFMFFTIYLGFHKSRQLATIKNNFSKKAYQTNLSVKVQLWRFRHTVYSLVRRTGMPLLLLILCFSLISINKQQYRKWDGVNSNVNPAHLSEHYLGIYNPLYNNGLSNIEEIIKVEQQLNIAFDISAHYIPWGDTYQFKNLQRVLDQKIHTPMISWEPWSSDFSFSDKKKTYQENKNIFKHILQGDFDNYIKQTAYAFKAYQNTVYLRFAHEFDNPFYPWSNTGNNTPEEFKKAWIYIWNIFKELGVDNIQWVWNPWKPASIALYYPGDTYVDYVGLTALNYGNQPSFEQLYAPFKSTLSAQGIQKPIILAEFGSLATNANQTTWINQGVESIAVNFPEITHLVIFNSSIDRNVPEQLNTPIINWKITDYDHLRNTLWEAEIRQENCSAITTDTLGLSKHNTTLHEVTQNIRGIIYNKGINWYKNYYTLDTYTLQKDFNQIRSLGFTHIKYFGSPIYNYNVFKTAKQYNLQIDYGFWLPEIADFTNNSINDLQEQILEKVRKLKNEQIISSWHFSNDLLSHYANTYKLEHVNSKQQQYAEWLKNLMIKIKAEDASRPIIVSLDLNKYIIKNTATLLSNAPPIDALAISIKREKDSCYLNQFVAYAKAHNIAYQLGAVPAKTLPQIVELYKDNKSLYIANYQDRHESNNMDLNGLIDFKGAIKPEFGQVRSFLNHHKYKSKDLKINILKPASRLKTDYPYHYSAVFKTSETPWSYQVPNPENSKLEWFLVKCDVYGNPLVMKSIGNNSKVHITIPEDFLNYKIILKYYYNGHVLTAVESLNTQATSSDSDSSV